MTADHCSTDPDRSAIVAEALSWIGTPYHQQASVKGAGCDCLGLIRGVWRGVYGTEPEAPPPYSPDWAEATGQETMLAAARRNLVETPIEAAREGDVLVFRWRTELPAKHAGVLIAPDRVLHAYEKSREGVTAFHLNPWWRRRIAGAFSFPGIA